MDTPSNRQQGVPRYDSPPLKSTRPPRCPPFVEISHEAQLLPYLEHVAPRPYNHGLNAGWDLREGERVLLSADNWHSELTIKAGENMLHTYNVKYDIRDIARGPI